MANDLTPQRLPWEPVPVGETVTKLQADLRFIVAYTAVMVHSKHETLQMLVNTRRGQIVPRGECKFSDGSAMEFQDIGMPQPGAPVMTVQELVAKAWETAKILGLELAP